MIMNAIGNSDVAVSTGTAQGGHSGTDAAAPATTSASPADRGSVPVVAAAGVVAAAAVAFFQTVCCFGVLKKPHAVLAG